jgi:hypothetical protein
MTATHETTRPGRTMAPNEGPAVPATALEVAADVVAPSATVIDTPLRSAVDEPSPAELPREPGDEAIWRRAAIGAVLGCALTVSPSPSSPGSPG